MGAARPFRFGVMASKAASGKEWAELARKVEDLGYATLVVPDHFTDQLATTPALTAAAAATETLRVGSLVYGVDFRHPALLAKEAATIDLLSGGRMELGLGAGWMNEDYAWTGIPHDPAPTRIARLSEAVEVVKALLAGGPVTHRGEAYQLRGLPGTPAPVGQPHPPILLGGGGRRVLTAAARLADIVSVNPNVGAGAWTPDAWATAMADATDAKMAWVREAAGERYPAIEICFLNFFTAVGDAAAARAPDIGKTMGGLPAEAVLASPNTLVGSVGALVEELEARRQRWDGTYHVVRADAVEAFAPVVARLAGR